MFKFIVTLLAALAVTAQAQDITGAGATFPAPLYAKWADAYNKATGTPAEAPPSEMAVLVAIRAELRAIREQNETK